MASYELMYTLVPDLEDEEYEAANERLSAIITDQGGKIEKLDVWGKRRLAYEIKKWREGYYTLMHFEAPAEAVKELDRVLRINEKVLRHLIVKREILESSANEKKGAGVKDV
ncbi:MAG: 30S ribosomal protein S6 [Firmicutes bacterium]|nr:30S ribosomal protein S6 [Bacillota bacterium]